MSDEVRTDVPAMLQFQATSRDRADEFLLLKVKMDGVRLAPGDFGWIPGIGPRVHGVYSDYVDGLTHVISSAAQAMFSIADAVTDAARAYEETDGAVAEALGRLEFDLAGTDLPEIR